MLLLNKKNLLFDFECVYNYKKVIRLYRNVIEFKRTKVGEGLSFWVIGIFP